MIRDESITSSNTKTFMRNRRDPLLESFQSRNIYLNRARGFTGEEPQQSCVRLHSSRSKTWLSLYCHIKNSRGMFAQLRYSTNKNLIHVHPTIKLLRDMPPSITLLNSIHYCHVESLLCAPQFECLSTN